MPWIYKTKRQVSYDTYRFSGAGDGSRTHTTSLEGWDSTAELHPRNAVYCIITRCVCQALFFVNDKKQTEEDGKMNFAAQFA